MAPAKKVSKKSKSKKVSHKFEIDCTHPVEDGIMQIGKFEEFMKNHVKVEGKINNLGKNVSNLAYNQSSGKFPVMMLTCRILCEVRCVMHFHTTSWRQLFVIVTLRILFAMEKSRFPDRHNLSATFRQDFHSTCYFCMNRVLTEFSTQKLRKKLHCACPKIYFFFRTDCNWFHVSILGNLYVSLGHHQSWW